MPGRPLLQRQEILDGDDEVERIEAPVEHRVAG
jgi:hypothetical protein